MPIYEYVCEEEHVTEKLLPTNQRDEWMKPGRGVCSTCGGKLIRRLQCTFTAKPKYPGATSTKALGSDSVFKPTSKKEWHQAVGRNHGRG